MKPEYHLHTNITPGQSIDIQRDFLHAFSRELCAACVDGMPILIPNKKSATVLPFSRPVPPSAVQPNEVQSCSNDICPNPTSAG